MKLSTLNEIDSAASANPFEQFALKDHQDSLNSKENDFLTNALSSRSNGATETEEFGPGFFQCDTRRGVDSEGTDLSSARTADGEQDSPSEELKATSAEQKRSDKHLSVTDRLHSETTQSVRSKQHPPLNK